MSKILIEGTQVGSEGIFSCNYSDPCQFYTPHPSLLPKEKEF